LMSWWYRQLLRPFLFQRDAEQAHAHAMRVLGWVGWRELPCGALESFFGSPSLPAEVFGLKFPNPIGLAAGMDKHAEAVPAWEALGFGFIELGGVTWHPQPGNPPPRLFRALPDEAVINRMGFNNQGAEVVAQKLSEWRALGRWPKSPVGINLGKSKITPLEDAPQDYANSFRVLRPHADFFVVNVSSPNTPGLRQLQRGEALDEILGAIHAAQSKERDPKPILVKVAPDISFEELDEILELVGPRQIAGIVATNTTVERPETSDAESQRVYAEPGGLSGRPLRKRSTEVVRRLYHQTRGKLPIIGVGGIFSAADAWEKITAGASLVQIYTGLIYEGPSLASAIVRGLVAQMEVDGISELRQAVGVAGD
jgi:dihydroorotate dehydrogenase